jgi:alpha-amylase/alpha-mannosidase (GH57 family)
MNRVHLVIYWHMHQPQYRDPATERYVMPWTRLHALKDYWGMVKLLEEFPGVHVTFNVVPGLGAQLEEYASGQFDSPWFRLAFAPVDDLEPAHKAEILDRGFQLNHDTMMRRWPRFVELHQRVEELGLEEAAEKFGPRDWRDLQVLSQLAWMDEEYLAHDAEVAALASRGANYSEADKQRLRAKQIELLARVLPEYRTAAARGQIEISTTPFFHPILPLLCDTDIARVANPYTPLPQPAFRHPEDAREQLVRARAFHERVFGQPPAGLWPSEGSVSVETLGIAAELSFRWFASDEGVLGRTLGVVFGRDASGIPAQAEKLYTPWRVQLGERQMVGIFRDRYLSDLVGFVYSRMTAQSAAEDLHRRIRAVGERLLPEATGRRPMTVSLILDGENAWEYFPGNGREFLRLFYRRIQDDPDIRPLTVTEAIEQAGEIPAIAQIFPGSWINANFDVWIGHREDVQAWEWLREARDFYARAGEQRAAGHADAPSAEQLAAAYDALLAAEGSDWCWWYGPEHTSASDPEFDALYRKYLTAVYAALGTEAPEYLAHPIKRVTERALFVPPSAFLEVKVDGRESSYFEWLGAGIYSAERQSGAMHGRVYFLHELLYGFDETNLFLRVDPFAEALAELGDFEYRVTLRAPGGRNVLVRIEVDAQTRGCTTSVEADGACLADIGERVAAAFGKILEVRVARELLTPASTRPEGSATATLSVGVELWQGGLPVDVLPAEGALKIQLGSDAFAWAGI